MAFGDDMLAPRRRAEVEIDPTRGAGQPFVDLARRRDRD